MDRWMTRLPLMVALCVPIPTAFPVWGANGHRAVAEIGSRHLDAEAKAAVEGILGVGALALARSATWPDEIRSDPRWDDIQTWHYVTVEDGVDFRDVVHEPQTINEVGNVAEAIMFLTDVVEGDATKRAQLEGFMRARGAAPYLGSVDAAALSLLVHFVGDVHQPLHVGRGEDAGGNGVGVSWFGSPRNLHFVWDEGLIEQQAFSFTELATVLDVASNAELAAWSDDPLGIWIQESIDLRRQVYSVQLPVEVQESLPSLGYEYAFDNTATANRRLLQGGVRLASLLNEVLP